MKIKTSLALLVIAALDYVNPDDDPMKKAAAAPAPKKDEPKKK